jgi:hypothetical protein
MKYPYISRAEVRKYQDEIINNDVSQIARSPDGFMYEYLNTRTVSPELDTRRNNYITRTLPAYLKNPTYRRWLSLVAWAYKTPQLHIK